MRSLAPVEVTGTQTGRHAGRLLPDSDSDGASFIPRRAFAPGEQVTVRTLPGSKGVHVRPWHFLVARPAGRIPNKPLPPIARFSGDVLSFHSRPDLTPAAVEIVRKSAKQAPGDVFLAPQQGPLQNGPMIVNRSGDLVWFKPVPSGDTVTDFRVQRYRGHPVLTWWQGFLGAGVGLGEDEVYDSSYRQIAVVRAANGLAADLHEFQLTPQGNALITAYYPVYWDGSSVKGPRRMIVLDSVVQEIDVKTGLLLFQWDSLDHVPLSDSYEPKPGSAGQPFDYFHVNSVQEDDDGNLVVSARNTWAAYKLDTTNGRTVWALGGKRSSFRLGTEAEFAFQHDVRVRSGDGRTLTLFDDGAGPPVVHKQSRGVTLKLDPDNKRAQVVRVSAHSPPLLANYEGNVQQLPDGHRFVGWGQQPYFTEFDADGRVTFDGRFVDANSSYRAFAFPWRGTPVNLPAVSATTAGRLTTAYVSWNGATEVRSWRVLAGAGPTALRPIATVPHQGFETRIQISTARFLAVQALDGHGRVLATSRTVSPR
jgi:hypothetical protein